MPETRSGPSPHQQAIVTAMPGGLPVPKSPNVQQPPAHGMKWSGTLEGGERVGLPGHALARFTWAGKPPQAHEATRKLGGWKWGWG